MAEYASELDKLKIIYQEIVEGCSSSNDGTLFFKHFTELDNIHLTRHKILLFNQYIEKGVPTEAERLKIIIENGEWSEKDEDDIASHKLVISDNEKLLPTVIHQQQGFIKSLIEKERKKLHDKLVERGNLISSTAEELSYRDAVHYNLFLATHKDARCKRRYFDSVDALDSLDIPEIDKFHDMMDKAMSKFTDQAVRQMAAMPFFLNIFSYAKEDVTRFLNKPLTALTSLQSYMFSCGARNLSILSQSEGNPPELIGTVTPNDILTWYDTQYSMILGKRNTKSS